MKKYLTIQGDTWDAISYRAYGSEFYTSELFDANPDLQKYLIFSANISVNIPDIQVAINTNLPPWERPVITEREVNNDLLDILNNYDNGLSDLLSYRFIDRYTERMIVATEKGL
jgi:phage tail protein X